MLVVGVGTPLVLAGAPAGADQVGTLQQQAQYIAGEIQAANVKLTILDELYHQAEGRVSFLAQRVSNATAAIRRTEKALDQDRSHLRAVAIEAYVTGGASQSLSVVFNGSQQTAGMQQAYIQAASGNLNESETTVLINQRALSLERANLDRTEQIAKANETAISSDVSQEIATTAQLNNEEAQVKGELAQAVEADWNRRRKERLSKLPSSNSPLPCQHRHPFRHPRRLRCPRRRQLRATARAKSP
jgi:DNA repair exonuclease SbcCD nuclease subunit